MGFAQSLETADNGATWTLELRPGLKFSDGTVFDAEAVAYNIARAANPDTGSPLRATAAQLVTEVVGPTTLRIASAPANALLPMTMSQGLAFIASPTAVKKKGEDFGANPVGPGPFQVKEVEYGISWTFERNPHYETFAPGQPYLDGLEIISAQLAQAIINVLRTGQAQLHRPNNAQIIEMARDAGLTVVTPPQPSIGTLTFNTSRRRSTIPVSGCAHPIRAPGRLVLPLQFGWSRQVAERTSPNACVRCSRSRAAGGRSAYCQGRRQPVAGLPTAARSASGCRVDAGVAEGARRADGDAAGSAAPGRGR